MMNFMKDISFLSLFTLVDALRISYPLKESPECATCNSYLDQLPGVRTPSGTGYLMMAFGSGYMNMAITQVALFRRVGENLPVSVITDNATYLEAIEAHVFDQIILYREECFLDGLTQLISTPQEQYDMMPQLRFLKLSPYSEFMKWDLDIVPTKKGTLDVWKAFRDHEQAFADFGRLGDRTWHWGYLGEISDALLREGKIKRPMHHTHAGVLYVNKNFDTPQRLQKHFDSMKDAFVHYDELHFLRWFRGGAATDEILISYAYARNENDWTPIEFGKLMSFNDFDTSEAHLVHIFDQGGWERAAVEVLGHAVNVSPAVKAHSVGKERLNLTSC